jgi:pimeloyl-ACP methyl ester carboxylesterase
MFELPAAIDDQLDKLAALARSDPALGGRVKDLKALTASPLDRLETPRLVRLPGEGGGARDFEIGRYDLALATVTLLRQTAFLRQLPLLYQRIEDGDASWLARWSAKVRAGQQTDLASLAITCASGASPERRARIREQAAVSPFGDAVDLLSAGVCAPFEKLGRQAQSGAPISGDMPVLMVSGELDPRAPPAYAEALLPGLPKARHVVFPGVSHDFGDGRDALLELVYRFLAHGETEPRRRPPGFTFMPSS